MNIILLKDEEIETVVGGSHESGIDTAFWHVPQDSPGYQQLLLFGIPPTSC